jgi:hypothetical protein
MDKMEEPRHRSHTVIRDYFVPLRVTALNDNATLYRPTQSLPESVTLESSATSVMTDLKQVPAQTIEPEASIEEANTKMIRQGVRLLFVTDAQHHLLGIVTATDIHGGHVVQVLLARGVSRQEVTVREIMTARDHLEAIDMRGAWSRSDMCYRRSSRWAASMPSWLRCRPHEQLTTQRQPGVMQTVRGLFSATQLPVNSGSTLSRATSPPPSPKSEALLAH